MVDAEGYRPNVGIILANGENRLLWAKRLHQNAWQFPQGGLNPGESPREALFRELGEELGLRAEHVELVAESGEWLRYDLPARFVRRGRVPLCIGQRQKWFLLRLQAADSLVRFDQGERPEFDGFRWVEYWHPLREVVAFKRAVYRSALSEFAPQLGMSRPEDDIAAAPAVRAELPAGGAASAN